MKAWLARNEETFTKWMYRVLIAMFAVNSVCDIACGNASGALGWACAFLWCYIAKGWHDTASLQDKLLTRILDRCRRNGEDAR